ncbi:MAG: hypothetical protein ABEJ80_01325 [Halarchaeum sp.]
MSEQAAAIDGAAVLHRRAIRTPIRNDTAERKLHENMMRLADARERKADLLADPDVPAIEAYDAELEYIVETFTRRLERVVGEDYRSVAAEYAGGARDDRLGHIAAYYVEGMWLMQQQATVTDMLYSLIILRYPDSFVLNLRFAEGFRAPGSVVYESPEQSDVALDDDYHDTYYAESTYSQKEAAAYIRDTATHLREAFPDPDETPPEERYGGVVAAVGRCSGTFSDYFGPVDPAPDRFERPVDHTVVVPEGPAARRTERDLLADGDLLV